MPRAPHRSFAVLWLLSLHVLADVAVGVYRSGDVNRELTDMFSAALSRGQLCLLAMWLAAGADPLSWRLCGLLGGIGFLFVLFLRTLFPGSYDLGAGAVWLEEEWAYFFRLSAPGDLLVKAPVLIGGVAIPLLAWRLAPAFRQGLGPSRWRRAFANSRRWQFGLAETAVWMATISVTLAAVFRTAPYPEWFAEMAAQWRAIWRFENPLSTFAVTSAAPYVLAAFAALWLAYGKTPLAIRAAVFAVLALGPAYGFELWLENLTAEDLSRELFLVWRQTAAETGTSALAAVVMAASILLYKLYGPTPLFLQSD